MMRKKCWILLLVVVLLQGCLAGQGLLTEGMEKADRSDFQGAFQVLERGLAREQQRENKQAIGAFLGAIGIVHLRQGDYPKALTHHEQALTIAREIGVRGHGSSRKASLDAIWETRWR